MEALDTLNEMIEDIFKAFSEGRDVAPAAQFRCEGYMQALLDSELDDWQSLQARLVNAADTYLNADSAELYRQAQGPVIHTHMATAPVYKGGAPEKGASSGSAQEGTTD